MKESAIQKLVFEAIKKYGKPRTVAWAVPNGKGMRRIAGNLPGVHDVHILHDGSFFTLEIKVERDGHVSREQLDFRDRVNEAGGYSFIGRGWDECRLWLEACGIIRREAA